MPPIDYKTKILLFCWSPSIDFSVCQVIETQFKKMSIFKKFQNFQSSIANSPIEQSLHIQGIYTHF